METGNTKSWQDLGAAGTVLCCQWGDKWHSPSGQQMGVSYQCKRMSNLTPTPATYQSGSGDGPSHEPCVQIWTHVSGKNHPKLEATQVSLSRGTDRQVNDIPRAPGRRTRGSLGHTGQISAARCSPEESSLRTLQPVRFNAYDILDEAKQWGQKTGQWWPGAGGRQQRVPWLDSAGHTTVGVCRNARHYVLIKFAFYRV